MADARPIVRYGDPVLHHPCEPVERFDAELAELVDVMFASMYAADGVGLAANQIGVALRLFVVDCPDADGNRVVATVANPQLELPADRDLDEDFEGCLSVPGVHRELARPAFAVVTGQDRTGAPVRIEGTGLLARCLQHETDHVEGLVYVDRLRKRERKRALEEMEELAAERG